MPLKPLLVRCFDNSITILQLQVSGNWSYFPIFMEVRKNGIHRVYLFFAFFISFNVFLHKEDGAFDPCREARASIFSFSDVNSQTASVQKDGFKTKSSAPEKKKLKIRTRFKAADIVDVPPIVVVVAVRQYPVVIEHTSLPQLFLSNASHPDFCLRGPPVA